MKDKKLQRKEKQKREKKKRKKMQQPDFKVKNNSKATSETVSYSFIDLCEM